MGDEAVRASWSTAKLLMRYLMAQQILLTPTDVAKCLQINERTVTQWLRKGHLRGFKIGKEWRVSELDLEAFLEASENIPSGSAPSAYFGGKSDINAVPVEGRERARLEP